MILISQDLQQLLGHVTYQLRCVVVLHLAGNLTQCLILLTATLLMCEFAVTACMALDYPTVLAVRNNII